MGGFLARDHCRRSSQRRVDTRARNLTFQNVSSVILNWDWNFEALLFSMSTRSLKRVSFIERPM